jgi:adenosylcobinamide-GDP ribazoletransferase
MKDSRVGAFGVVGVVLLLLIKFSTLAALPLAFRMPALVTIPTLARWAMTWAMARYPLARKEGTGVFFSAGLGWRQVIIASVVAVTAALIFMNWLGAVMLAVTWLVATLVARLAVVRITGLTGDVYGAICEVTETVLIIVALVVR